MTQLNGIGPLIQHALQNDQKIDLSELKAIQTEALKDGVSSDERQMLTDALTQNQFTSEALPSVIQFVAEALKAPQTPTTVPVASEKSPAEKAPSESTEKAASAEPPKGKWTTSHEIQGSFNHTSVSSGWTDQYGGEKTATKIEGSLQTEANYQKGGFSWNNKLRVEYGNTFVKGDKDTERAVSRDNFEGTSEVARTISDKGNWKVEIPYASLYTKGPLTQIDGRKFRETTGAKVTYKNDESNTEFSAKVGAGLQQTHNAESRQWDTEAGVEVVLEAKQSFGIFKAPVVSAFGGKEENVTFLDRLEATASVNSFTPLHQGQALDSTDVVVRTGARYYVNDNKSIWVGANKEWQYGGKEDSTWESKFSGSVGFKFD